MFGRKKKKKSKYMFTSMLKTMLKPILFALLPVLEKMIDLWKIQLLDQIPKVSTKDLTGFLSDQIDNLSGNIVKQIKESLKE